MITGNCLVAAQKSELNQSFPKYYSEEGAKDLVFIQLPATKQSSRKIIRDIGQSYVPVFTYNPAHPVNAKIQLFEYLMLYGQAPQLLLAIEQAEELTEKGLIKSHMFSGYTECSR